MHPTVRKSTINSTEAQVKIFLLLQELVNFLLPGICSSLMLDFEVRGWKIEAEDKPHEMHL